MIKNWYLTFFWAFCSGCVGKLCCLSDSIAGDKIFMSVLICWGKNQLVRWKFDRTSCVTVCEMHLECWTLYGVVGTWIGEFSGLPFLSRKDFRRSESQIWINFSKKKISSLRENGRSLWDLFSISVLIGKNFSKIVSGPLLLPQINFQKNHLPRSHYYLDFNRLASR